MGHNTASMTMRFRSERAFFDGYRRSLLLKTDQLLFDELWDVIEAYVPSVEKSNHPLLIATLLMSMILEQRKLITALQSQLEKLQHEVRTDQQSQAADRARLEAEIQRLDNDVDSRLRAVRSEISEILYPSDAAL
jgi:cell division FtsZ-interacting protein ZapD